MELIAYNNAKYFQIDGGVDGAMDGGVVVHIIYSLCTDNDLQSLIYYLTVCIEFSCERRGGRWVDYVVACGVEAYMYMTHLLCTDNDM